MQLDQGPTYTVTWGLLARGRGRGRGVAGGQCLLWTRGGHRDPPGPGGEMTLLSLVVTPLSHLVQPSQDPTSQSAPHLTAQSLSLSGAVTSRQSSTEVSTLGQVKVTQVTFLLWLPNPQ